MGSWFTWDCYFLYKDLFYIFCFQLVSLFSLSIPPSFVKSSALFLESVASSFSCVCVRFMCHSLDVSVLVFPLWTCFPILSHLCVC